MSGGEGFADCKIAKLHLQCAKLFAIVLQKCPKGKEREGGGSILYNDQHVRMSPGLGRGFC